MLNILANSLLIATRTENFQSQKDCDWGMQNKPVNGYMSTRKRRLLIPNNSTPDGNDKNAVRIFAIVHSSAELPFIRKD
ncbi:MAG: hypothetical protein GY742_02510 [Hyphomicrobiales bacterium]|nr:hypothetical protein [Hyphomicrobiales bacterium]